MTDPESRVGGEITKSAELRDVILEHLPQKAASARRRVEAHYLCINGSTRTDLIFSYDSDEDEQVVGIEAVENLGTLMMPDSEPAPAVRKRCQLDAVSGKVLAYDEEHGCIVNDYFASLDEPNGGGQKPEEQLLGVLFGEEISLERRLTVFTQAEHDYLLSLPEKI